MELLLRGKIMLLFEWNCWSATASRETDRAGDSRGVGVVWWFRGLWRAGANWWGVTVHCLRRLIDWLRSIDASIHRSGRRC